MQLGDEVLTYLTNFQKINESIRVEEGNILTTKSKLGTMYARAELSVSFPMTFSIYNLNRFISVASMMKNGEIVFDKNYLTFKEGKKSIKYSYCDPMTITFPDKPPKPFQEEDIITEFVLSADMLKESMDAMNILKHDGLIIQGEDGKLSITTWNEINEDAFTLEVGDTDEEFSFIIEKSKLTFIPKEYRVSLNKKKYIHMETEKLQYWVACNHKSTVGE